MKNLLENLMARFGWVSAEQYEYGIRCLERDLEERDRMIQAQTYAIERLEKQHKVTMKAICDNMLPIQSPIVVMDRRRPHAQASPEADSSDPSS